MNANAYNQTRADANKWMTHQQQEETCHERQ